MCAESSTVLSGFGNYTRELLTRLYNTGKYEIAELSCYRTSKTIKKEPWKVYPVAVDNTNQKLYTQYASSATNQFGHWRFELALLDFKPDIVFDIRDFWYFGFEEVSPLRPFYYWLIAPTYDSTPQRLETLSSFKNADMVAFHTDWARNDLLSYNTHNNFNIGPVVNDSVDTKIFKPITTSKKFNRAQHNIPQDAFIIGSVMRNQKRKLIYDLFKIIKNTIVSNPNKNIILYLHTSYPETSGWELPSLLLEHDILHHVYFTYKCAGCKHHFSSIFRDAVCVCPKCKTKKAKLANTSDGLSPEDMNKIYNLFDIYVQYAICEGFGIPQVEAAAAGIPVITVNHGAMAEVGSNVGGKLVDLQIEFRELETNADRVFPNNNHCQTLIQEFIDMTPNELINKSKQTRSFLVENYSWDKTAKIFEEIFDNIDLSNTLPWDYPKRSTNHQHEILDYPNNRDFIYSIIDNNIQDHWIKHTNFVQEMIKCLDHGFVINNNQIVPFDKRAGLKILEVYMNNKENFESMRVNPNFIKPEELSYFYNY